MPSPEDQSPPPQLTTLLARLATSGVEFILVGGLAAVAQGAPFATFDADIVHQRSSESVDRLLPFLTSIGAFYRERRSLRLPPSRQALVGPGRSLFSTDLGPLDVLGAIEEGRDYDALLPDTVEIHVAGHLVRVLSLETILRLKRASNHPKDRLVVPVLEAALQALKR